MKTFIKQNWFKLGIIIAVLVIGIFYLSNYKNSDTEILTMKAKCAKDGESFMVKSFQENPPETMTVFKEFVYSPELKTCLVNISRITSPQHWYYAIIDIYTDKEIASYTLDKTDKESWTATPLSDNYKKYNTLKNKYFPQL